MFNVIVSWWDERAGYRAANHQIKAFELGFYSDQEIIEFRPNYFVGRRALLNGPFQRGWRSRWSELGYADARAGKCRAKQFGSNAYDLAIQNALAERAKYGWKNPRLEAEFGRQVDA